MAFSWKLAIDVGPRSLTHAEWKGWPFPFTLALTPTYRGCSPRLRGWPEWIELIETGWNSRLMVITGQASPALTLKKKQDRQSHLWLFVSLTTVSHFIPFSCSPRSHKRRFLSVHLGGKGESQVKPQRADPEPGLRHGSSLSSVNKYYANRGMGLRLSCADILDQVVLCLENWSRGSGMFNTPRDEIETTFPTSFHHWLAEGI